MTDFTYGKNSTARIATCHPVLQEVAFSVIEMTPIDLIIIHGWRGQEEQDELVRIGVSKTLWPTSKHNHVTQPGGSSEFVPCSMAIDFAPWVKGFIPWGDTHAFAVIAGVWFAAAKESGVGLRWGGDWDMDGSTTDQKFMDWGHVEIRVSG